jgi:hypothetical protein
VSPPCRHREKNLALETAKARPNITSRPLKTPKGRNYAHGSPLTCSRLPREKLNEPISRFHSSRSAGHSHHDHLGLHVDSLSKRSKSPPELALRAWVRR